MDIPPDRTAVAGQVCDLNPMGTDGFEFIEYAAPDPVAMGQLFERMGFTAVGRHKRKDVIRYKQGEINFLPNAVYSPLACIQLTLKTAREVLSAS